MHVGGNAVSTEMAQRFSALLRCRLTLTELDAVRWRNSQDATDVCHSHDILDANELMAEAFESVMGRPINLQNANDCALWADAWATAKANHFYTP